MPLGFVFRKGLKRSGGWRLWLLGEPDRGVRPHRPLERCGLPSKGLRDKLSAYQHVFQAMGRGLAVPVPGSASEITAGYVLQSHELGTAELKKLASYIFAVGASGKRKHKHHTWTVTTWDKMTKRSTIERRGGAADKAQLSAPAPRHKKRRRLSAATVAGDDSDDDGN